VLLFQSLKDEIGSNIHLYSPFLQPSDSGSVMIEGQQITGLDVTQLSDSVFSQYDRAIQAFTYLNYNFLGIRTVANDTDLNYQISPIWGVMAGYHYSNRRIRSIEQFTFLGEVSATPSEQTNQLHAGDLGLRVKPWKPLSVLLSAEVGRNDQPFTPTADRDYHVLNGRIQYKTKTLQLTGTGSANYNVNSISLSSYSSKARTYSIDTTWTPGNWLALDAGFSRTHLYTVGGIAYFLNQQIVNSQTSLYLSNINSAYFGARLNIKGRADVYLGYTRVQDVGDGRANSLGSGIGSPLPLFEAVQTFPVTFQSPQVRLSVKLNGKLRWNAGYQYYGYGQQFSAAQNYRANTGYTSISASF
jgi:hypothetical protein